MSGDPECCRGTYEGRTLLPALGRKLSSLATQAEFPTVMLSHTRHLASAKWSRGAKRQKVERQSDRKRWRRDKRWTTKSGGEIQKRGRRWETEGRGEASVHLNTTQQPYCYWCVSAWAEWGVKLYTGPKGKVSQFTVCFSSRTWISGYFAIMTVMRECTLYNHEVSCQKTHNSSSFDHLKWLCCTGGTQYLIQNKMHPSIHPVSILNRLRAKTQIIRQ